MNQVSVLQQMYINQAQFVVGKQPEKLTPEPPKYCIHFILPLFLGLLLCGVPLTSMVTLYLTNQCSTAGSTTSTSTITTVTTQTQINQTNASISVNQTYYCSGVSPYTLWLNFMSVGIYMNIDTSNCNFNSTPFYYTSMAGNSSHWDLAGYTAIYSPTKHTFTVYANSLAGWNSAQMLNYSVIYAWNVNWFGISK